MRTRRDILASTLVLVAASLSRAAAQDAWPSRPIRVVVPLAPGGGVDLVARLVLDKIGDSLGQRIVVENQGGAGGTIAGANVARAEPDGYTFIFQSVSSAVVNALLYKKLSYDPVNDFAAVSLVAQFPLVAIIHPDIPARDINEFIALLKANPGKYSYGTSGVGTSPHLAGELFKSLAGVDIVHVPYRGNAAALTDLLGGRVALMFDGVAPQLANIQTGKVRALAVTTKERSKVLPTVPPMHEALAGYELPFWTALYAPAKTPKTILDRFAAETAKAVSHPEVARRLAELGVDGVGSTPEVLDRFWRQQLAYYGDIVVKNKISVGQ